MNLGFLRKMDWKILKVMSTSLIFVVLFSTVLSIPLVTSAQANNVGNAASDATTQPLPDKTGCSSLSLGLNLIGCLVSRLNSFIGFAAGLCITLVMMIFEYALYINNNVLRLPAVQIGWNFTRDVANMGFVLGIIVISFATILRSQSYGVKQLIVRLILAAVLVNLSLSIVGIFLDLSGIPTQFFIDKITGFTGSGPGGMSTTLGAAFNIQNIGAINKTAAERDLGYSGEGMIMFFSVLFSLIFSFVILVTLIALAYMFLHRFVTLAVLIIMLPLAILAWVFPIFRGRWGQWLSKFIQWTFFAPAALFFLYLAIYTVRVQGNYLTVAAQNLKSVPMGSAVAIETMTRVGTNDPVLLMANMVMMILLTFGGLFAAQSMGIAGASAAMDIARSGSRRILRSTTATPARLAYERSLTRGARVDEEGKLQQSYAQRAATRLASASLFGVNVGRFMSGASEKINAAVKDQQAKVTPERKNFDDQTKEYRIATLNRMTGVADPTRASALLLSMAQKGELRDLDDNGKRRLENLLSKLNETGSGKEFARYMPEYAKKVGQEIKNVMPTAPTDAYKEMKADVFDSTKGGESAEQSVLYASSSGLRTIGESNSAAVPAIMRTFEKLGAELKNFDEAEHRKTIQDKSGSSNKADVDAVKEAEEKIARYKRYQVQRGVLYSNPVFAGEANKELLEEWHEEKRVEREGKKGGKEERGGGKLVDQYGRSLT